jgi:hypothetical protein
MKKLILKNFYIILVGAFSMLSGVIIAIIWIFYKYPDFNYIIAVKNDISILFLNTILVVLGIFTIAGSLFYYQESTKKNEDEQYIPPAT